MINLQDWKTKNNTLGWLIAILASFVYFLSLAPTVSWWDCGEFISCAFKLQVGHPPGAPFYLIISRVWSIFFPKEYAAIAINSVSAIASGATAMFLFWTITRIARKLTTLNKKSENSILIAAAIGTLTFAFTDTFWFSAVEAEVYALSTLFTAIVFWIILKWNDEVSQGRSFQWLVLLAYLMGLSIGVHLLNLLAIPAIVLLAFLKTNPFTLKNTFKAITIGSLLLLLVMYGIIQGLPLITFHIEIFVVNQLGLPIHSGELLILFALFSIISATIYFSRKRRLVKLELISIMFGVLLIGYMSYATIVIRSAANPPIDENNPEQVDNFKSYINREQYGDRPLIWGQYYSAPIVAAKKRKPVYYLQDNKYQPLGKAFSGYIYDSGYETIFPRMYSSRNGHPSAYRQWSRYIQSKEQHPDRPTWGNNFRFFIDYQLIHMYFRYFMWNFSGRQNDRQGHGGVLNGNWITGIDFIDQFRLGNQTNQPPSIKNSMSRNKYFLLPFLLGIFGIAWLLSRGRKGKKWLFVLSVLFFFTGIAIVLYLNQKPLEPRERDYSYVASFYTFSIFIGFGVLQLFDVLDKRFSHQLALTFSALISLTVPTLLFYQNWDDHNRAHKHAAHNLAYNQLISCKPNAILFTYGDNDTFPLWYLQEVEGVRTDVRICNVSLLGADWYISQMRQKAYLSNPVKINIEKAKYRSGIRDICIVNPSSDTIDINNALQFVWNDSKETQTTINSNRNYHLVPSSSLMWKGQVLSTSDKYISKSELLTLQIIAQNPNRPIYFNGSVLKTAQFNYKEYVKCTGMVYELIPRQTVSQFNIPGQVEPLALYSLITTQYKWGGWEQSNIVWDTHNQAQISVFDIRLLLARLATELNQINEKSKAIEVLRLEQQLFPANKLPYNSHSFAIARAWAQIGNTDEATRILEQMANIKIDELVYYLSLHNQYLNSVSVSQKNAIEDIRSILIIAQELGMKKLYQNIQTQIQLLTSPQ